jgi:excisionase family DNA binding protein
MSIAPLLLGIEDVALMLGISPWTVRKYVANGILPSVRIGRRVLIEPGEIQKLIEQNRRRGK